MKQFIKKDDEPYIGKVVWAWDRGRVGRGLNIYLPCPQCKGNVRYVEKSKNSVDDMEHPKYSVRLCQKCGNKNRRKKLASGDENGIGKEQRRKNGLIEVNVLCLQCDGNARYVRRDKNHVDDMKCSRYSTSPCKKCARKNQIKILASGDENGIGKERRNKHGGSEVNVLCPQCEGNPRYVNRHKNYVDDMKCPRYSTSPCKKCKKKNRRIGYINYYGYQKLTISTDDLYFLTTSPASRNKYGGTILEHRLVMAQHKKRNLFPEETVHHINGDRLDNRIENLELWAGRHGKGQRTKDIADKELLLENAVLQAKIKQLESKYESAIYMR